MAKSIVFSSGQPRTVEPSGNLEVLEASLTELMLRQATEIGNIICQEPFGQLETLDLYPPLLVHIPKQVNSHILT